MKSANPLTCDRQFRSFFQSFVPCESSDSRRSFRSRDAAILTSERIVRLISMSKSIFALIISANSSGHRCVRSHKQGISFFRSPSYHPIIVSYERSEKLRYTYENACEPQQRSVKSADDVPIAKLDLLNLLRQDSWHRVDNPSSLLDRSHPERSDLVRNELPENLVCTVHIQPRQEHRHEPESKDAHNRLLDERIIRFDGLSSRALMRRTDTRLDDETTSFRSIASDEVAEGIGREERKRRIGKGRRNVGV